LIGGVEFYHTGRAVKVKVEGLGKWTPTIGLDAKLNIPGIFSSTILNHENIGKSDDELVA
jgi:hypothetical protein